MVARSFVLSDREKKSSFPSGGTNPLYFSWNSPKGYTREERGAEERRKAASLVFFLVPATLKPAVLIFPLVFVLVRLNHYFIFFPPFFFIHIRLVPLSSFGLGLSPAALGLPVFSRDFFHPPAEFFLTNFPSLLFRFVLLAYRSFTFPHLWLSCLFL